MFPSVTTVEAFTQCDFVNVDELTVIGLRKRARAWGIPTGGLRTDMEWRIAIESEKRCFAETGIPDL